MAEARRRLDNIQTHLLPLVYEFNNLHPAIRSGLYRFILDDITRNGGSIGPGDLERFATDTAERFDLLYQAIGNQKMDFTTYNKDRDITRKRVLVGALAEDFRSSFAMLPTITPTGPFMEVLGIVADAVDTSLGKDVVGDVLRDLKAGQFWDSL
jgi:hypothetical protein